MLINYCPVSLYALCQSRIENFYQIILKIFRIFPGDFWNYYEKKFVN